MVATGTGWSVQAIDATPWPDLQDLLCYWGHHPPVHVLLRNFLRSEDRSTGHIPTEDELAAGIADLT